MNIEDLRQLFRRRGLRERAFDAGLRGQPMPNLARWVPTPEEIANVQSVYAAARELNARMTDPPDTAWKPHGRLFS